jgi:hypothetical protein
MHRSSGECRFNTKALVIIWRWCKVLKTELLGVDHYRAFVAESKRLGYPKSGELWAIKHCAQVIQRT